MPGTGAGSPKTPAVEADRLVRTLAEIDSRLLEKEAAGVGGGGELSDSAWPVVTARAAAFLGRTFWAQKRGSKQQNRAYTQ